MVSSERSSISVLEYRQRAAALIPKGNRASRPDRSNSLMLSRNPVTTLLIVFALIVGIAGCQAAPSGPIGGTVTVVGSWSGAEEQAFLAMVNPFERDSGITVQYKGTRDLNGQLWESVAKGEPPDVAGLPGPGQMAEFARHGSLKDLSATIDVSQYKADTVPTFIDLGTVDAKLVGVFIKASLKGLIWYNPNNYTLDPPNTWDDLERSANIARRDEIKTWCMSLGSAATTGWPGTDWIEDIVLRQGGPAVYDDWVAGRLAWTSPEIRSAFEFYGEIVSDAYGGTAGFVGTDFGDGGNGLFSTPPECLFHHQATFMTEFFESRAGARKGEYDFFPFPVIDPQYANSVTGGGDLFGMFNDTPQSRALMEYLLTPEAQQIWVAAGGALSVNTKVTEYPDDISRRAASILTSAERFRFDASDLMPEQMNAAFLQAVVDYTADPSQLDTILQTLDLVQQSGTGPAPIGP
jgi:alpha-glucoside transport system substrate-binding protein